MTWPTIFIEHILLKEERLTTGAHSTNVDKQRTIKKEDKNSGSAKNYHERVTKTNKKLPEVLDKCALWESGHP